MKQNVPGLDFIMQLKPVTYHLNVAAINNQLMIADTLINQQTVAEKSAIQYTGFIAQEVEAAANAINYNFSGVDKPQDENGLYGLRYAEFVVPIVQAMQEQQQIIEKQQAQIDTLINELAFIKASLQTK